MHSNGVFSRSSLGDFIGASQNTVDSSIVYESDGEGNYWAYINDSADGIAPYLTDAVGQSGYINLFKWNPFDSGAPVPQVIGLSYSA